jgi:hypothetical protein
MDTTGAVCVVQANTTGLRWRKVRPPVCVTGTPASGTCRPAGELAALLAAEVAG